MKSLHRLYWCYILLSIPALSEASWKIENSKLSLKPPPAPGSASEKNDYRILLDYQKNRTEDECKAAGKQSFASMKVLFGPSTGMLSQKELEEVESFGDEVIETIDSESSTFKSRFLRKRPYDANAKIIPCVRKPGGQKSYPSSHAAMGQVLGQLLSEVFPDKKSDLIAQGKQIGENRILGGVHHPSDIEAGRDLGTQILAELRRNPDFKREFKKLLEK